MGSNIQRAAIVTKRENKEAENAGAKVASLLIKDGVKIYSVSPLKLDGADQVEEEELKDLKLDLVFSIGGDGTTLRAFRSMPNNIPLFSINSGGHRGILSEVGADHIDQATRAIMAGKYFYDSRIRISASVNGKSFPPALNDIFITRVSLTRTPLVSIKLMGDEIKQRMDGIVVSTPTGSTGHSFSIGGPVLHEGMSCLILSPVAPVNRMPQVVIPVEDIVIQSTYESHIIIDGQETFTVPADKHIKISRFSDDATFLRLEKKGMRQLAKLGFSKFEF